MVSERAPMVLPSPRNAPAYGDDGSMQLRLSEPVKRKLVAPSGRDGVVAFDAGEHVVAGPAGVVSGVNVGPVEVQQVDDAGLPGHDLAPSRVRSASVMVRSGPGV